ncbi:MAG: sulfatase [Planctomycetes bacterium]|nr:sulfatase [Planctomycetota bacterium]
MSERPNIIYFVCHDLGRHLETYGLPFTNTRLSDFAESGIVFNRAFCTSPACSPSRMCAMTGQYAHVSNGMGLAHTGWPLGDDVLSIVEYLKEAGYETAHVGHEHEWHPHSGRYDFEGNYHWDDSTCENAISDAITFLETKKSDKPFYLNVGTQEVHACRFNDPEIVDDCYGGRTAADDTILPLYTEDNAQARAYMSGFQSAIQYMDSEFGRLLDALKESAYADNTIVIFTTDHGIAPPKLDISKGTLYEAGVGISLIMQLPKGMAQAYRINDLIPNIDFVPTLLEAAGAEIPERVNGRSFWPLLQGKNYQTNAAVFTERNFHGELLNGDEDYTQLLDPIRAMRTDRYHYIRWYEPDLKPDAVPAHCTVGDGKRDGERLYDVRTDGLECVDISERPEYRHVLADMRQQVDQWMQDTDDWLLSGERPQQPCAEGWGGNWPRIPQRVPWSGVP